MWVPWAHLQDSEARLLFSVRKIERGRTERAGLILGHEGESPDGAMLTDMIAAMGGAYEFTKNASANLRRKDDAFNPALGGFMSGTMLGLRCMSLNA